LGIDLRRWLKGRGEETDLGLAHKHCFRNREELQSSRVAGCFYCLRRFAPEEIDVWHDAGITAECPYCNIDSVIGDASGIPMSDDFLEAMHARFFS
jgi:hypothetical protein